MAEAKPYKEGTGWSMRRRVLGQDLYVSGHKTVTAAKKAMEDLVKPLKLRGKPKGLGPHRTTVAQAMQDMGVERLPFMKGADQEARRINCYLRAAGLATLRVTKFKDEPAAQGATPQPGEDVKRQFYVVSLEPPQAGRKMARGLSEHRQSQAAQTAEADRERDALARMTMADVQAYHVQEFMDALRKVREPATVQLERALLRRLFNYANKVWCWTEPGQNPAVGLTMPKVDNGRDRVMSLDEQRRLDTAIQECRNALVGPTLTLLRETAMRTGEPLEYALWKDVDWDAKLIKLRDSKNRKRDVPLSPAAIDALQQLAVLNPPQPEEHIIRMSYNALAAAWRRACERAGVEDLHLHDLRHTAATRMALKSGNVFLVKALTGLKTMSQLERYVNVKASDVVALMHAPEPAPAAAPATPSPQAQAPAEELVDVVGNLVKHDFTRRRAA
jgi:integrase